MQSLAALTPKRNLKLDDILDGIAHWPRDSQDRAACDFLAQSLRGRTVNERPEQKETVGEEPHELAYSSVTGGEVFEMSDRS